MTLKKWYVVEDDSRLDENGNGNLGIAISKYEDDPTDAIAWMQEGTIKDAILMSYAPELLLAVLKFLDFHRLDFDKASSTTIQSKYDEAVEFAEDLIKRYDGETK